MLITHFKVIYFTVWNNHSHIKSIEENIISDKVKCIHFNGDCENNIFNAVIGYLRLPINDKLDTTIPLDL